MDEGDATGMKGDASVRIGTRSSIFKVSLYRTAHVGKLAAYLMVTAGEQFHFKQKIPFRLTNVFIYELCQFCILADDTGTAYVGFVLLFISPEHSFEQAFLLGRLVAYQRPVDLRDIAVTEHGVEAFESLGSLGKDHNAADRTVQTVRKPHEHLTGLIVALCDECFICLSQRLVGSLVSLYDLPYLLVDNEKMIVFVENP